MILSRALHNTCDIPYIFLHFAHFIEHLITRAHLNKLQYEAKNHVHGKNPLAHMRKSRVSKYIDRMYS